MRLPPSPTQTELTSGWLTSWTRAPLPGLMALLWVKDRASDQAEWARALWQIDQRFRNQDSLFTTFTDGFHKLVLQRSKQRERQSALCLDQVPSTLLRNKKLSDIKRTKRICRQSVIVWKFQAGWRVGRCAMRDGKGFCLPETHLNKILKQNSMYLII